MEACPVDTSVVAFENVFDDGIRVAEEIGLALIRSLHLVFEGEWLSCSHLLAEAW
jgi:hypothetical protein